MTGTRGTVLVVDDHESILFALDYRFGQRGFRVLKAASGPEALELCRTSTPDVIVSDIAMPGMDGFEFCRRIRREAALASVPVVFLTARKGDEDRERARAAGVDAYVLKTSSLQEVVAEVGALMERRAGPPPPPPSAETAPSGAMPSDPGPARPEAKADPSPSRAAASPGRCLTLLMAYLAAEDRDAVLDELGRYFGLPRPEVSTGGVADFVEFPIAGRPVRLFLFRGERRFSFTWDMLPERPAAAFFVSSGDGGEEEAEAGFFREHLGRGGLERIYWLRRRAPADGGPQKDWIREVESTGPLLQGILSEEGGMDHG